MKQPLITLPLIRLKGRERERERARKGESKRKESEGDPWKVFCCGVIRLCCCCLQSGTTKSKMQVTVNGVSFFMFVCVVHVCICVAAHHSEH